MTNASKESYTPVITEQADTLYVVWEDHRHDPTNRRSELYFKRGGSEAISIKKSPSTEYNSCLIGYPNPSNVSTVIAYQLPASGHVTLEVYNLLGRRVATLVDERQEVGYRSVIWDASQVSSGLYFYKLTAGDYSETRRMMLVK